MAAFTLEEFLVVEPGRLAQGRALDHHQLFAGRHVAEQLDDLLLIVDTGNGTHEQLIAHPDGE
ncbi:hypothetical protein D3C78_1890730 [compost metagenome]